MKKIIFLIAGCLFFLASEAQMSFGKLKGRWVTPDGGGIEIVDSSKIYIIYGDQKKQVSSFNADFSKSPCWLDITVKNGTDTFRMKTLLLAVNDNLLQWQVFEDGDRPAHFSSDKGEMVYLRRKKF